MAPRAVHGERGMAEALERFVENGGTLVTGFMSGIVDQSDNVHLGGYPGPLRKMCGIWAEEIDALAPEQTNTLRFTDGTESKCSLLCDILHLEGAQALATYGEDSTKAPPLSPERLRQGHCLLCGNPARGRWPGQNPGRRSCRRWGGAPHHRGHPLEIVKRVEGRR